MRLLQTRRRGRARDVAAAGRFQILRPPLGLDMIDSRFDRGMHAGFGNVANPRRYRVQIDIGARRQQRPPSPPGSEWPKAG